MLCVPLIVIMSIYDCYDLREYLSKDNCTNNRISIMQFKLAVNWLVNNFYFTYIVLILFLVVSTGLCSGFILIARCLIKGIPAVKYKFCLNFELSLNSIRWFQRDHIRIRPMMLLMGFVTIAFIMQFLSFTQNGIYMSIIGGIGGGYLVGVLHSLHNKFKEESENGTETQNPESRV